MRKFLLFVLIVGAVATFFYIRMHPELLQKIRESSTRSEEEKKGTAKQRKDVVDEAIDYATGNTSTKAYHRAKDKIGRAREQHEGQVQEALSD